MMGISGIQNIDNEKIEDIALCEKATSKCKNILKERVFLTIARHQNSQLAVIKRHPCPPGD